MADQRLARLALAEGGRSNKSAAARTGPNLGLYGPLADAPHSPEQTATNCQILAADRNIAASAAIIRGARP